MSSTDKYEILMQLLNRINLGIQHGVTTGNQACGPSCPFRFDPVLNRIEAWAYTGFTPGSLAVFDCKGKYDLRPIKFDNAVRYRLSRLNEVCDERMKC
jgi:hypothetical protein